MATGSSAALPLSAELVAVLAKRGVKTAGHVWGVFGEEDLEFSGVSRVLGQFEPEANVAPDIWAMWVWELVVCLSTCLERDARDAARIFRKDDAEWALDLLRRKRAGAMEELPTTGLHAGLAALVGAPPPAKRWRTGRVVRRESAEGPDARRRQESLEHGKWSDAAVEVLLKVGFPVIHDADGSARSPGSLRCLFSRRRSSTLRARARVFRKFLAWVEHRSSTVDFTARHVLAYLADLRESAVGCTVPRAVYYAILFFEKAGGVEPGRMVCNDPLVEATAAAMEAELPKIRTARCEAVRYGLLVMISMELGVTDEAMPLYYRLCVRVSTSQGLELLEVRRHSWPQPH